jgi:HEAT repeats
MPSFLRIPIRPGAEPYEAVSFCGEQDWILSDKQLGDKFTDYVFEWDDSRIHVIWDYAVEKYFFSINGSRMEDAAEIIYEASRKKFHRLKVCEFKEAIDLATQLKKPADIYYAVLVSNDEYNQEIFDCYINAFKSNDPDIRFYACTSLGYIYGWEKQLKPLLEKVVSDDDDESVRKIAEKTLKSLVKHDWNRNVVHT